MAGPTPPLSATQIEQMRNSYRFDILAKFLLTLEENKIVTGFVILNIAIRLRWRTHHRGRMAM